jgi:lipoprotein-anchoring transpeptidase ErfK/SrfK
MASSVSWKALCKQAKQALVAGRRAEARALALEAAKLAPDREEPWLLLASMASPRASVSYFEKALQINPTNHRAKQYLKKAQQSAARKNEGASDSKDAAVLALPRPANLVLLSLLVVTAGLAALAWMRPPAFDDGMKSLWPAPIRQGDAATPTQAAFTATFTPFASMTPLPSSTPTATATPPPSATPLPTATATVNPNLGSIEKYQVDRPASVSDEERWIEVNLTDQTLLAYEGSDLVKSFVISSGRPNTPTVTGEFRIWVKVRNQTMSGPGYSIPNVPWVMYFYKSYGIHGTWWHNNFGNPMSAGCVNMTVDDALWMYNWASVGTVVDVHY